LPFGHPISGGNSFSSAGTNVPQKQMISSVFISWHPATPMLIQAGTLPSTHRSDAARAAGKCKRSVGFRNRPPKNLIVSGAPLALGTSYELIVKHRSTGSSSRT
jgi:hypothetical protein